MIELLRTIPKLAWLFIGGTLFWILGLGAWIYDEITWGHQSVRGPVEFIVMAILFAFSAWHSRRRHLASLDAAGEERPAEVDADA